MSLTWGLILTYALFFVLLLRAVDSVIVGHYAAALVPHSMLSRKAPLWLLLLCAQVPEFFWLALSLAGVETPSPDSMLDATFSGLQVEMTYSHNLVPALLQAAVVGVLVLAVFRQRALAAWCAGLTLFHVLCDFVVGLKHQVLGLQTPQVSLDTYGRAPYVAFLIELVFALAVVIWFQRREAAQGRPISARRRVRLAVLFVIGIAVWVPAAYTPMRSLLP